MIRVLMILFLFLGGCAKRVDYPSSEMSSGYGSGGGGYAEADYDAMPMAEAETVSRGGGRAKKSANFGAAPPAPPPPPAARPSGARPAPAPAPAPQPATPATPAPARMVHYDGFARVRVTKPADLLEEAEALATEAGGRVDRLSGNTITLRVPVESFKEVWEAVLALGEVVDQNVRADDITEQFLAVDLRVKTLKTTRDRLIVLLGKATEEEEKLRLLAQITRVTEQLDAFETQRRALADLAAYSRISVEAIPRRAYTGTQRPELDGMRWIAQLSAFRRAVFDDDKRIELPEPAGLVTLSKKGPFAAESPDGTVLWTMRLPNDPQGDGAFWVSAIRDRIAESFTEVSEQTLGSWSCLVLNEPGADEPYQWQVCIQPDGKHLKVGQVFYPSPAQVDRYSGPIEGAFKAGGGA